MAGDDAVRQELRSLSERYARAVDRRDAEAFVAVFRPDAGLFVHEPADAPSPARRRVGHDELATIPARLERYRATFHLVGNATYEVVGDEASGEVYCAAHHLIEDDGGRTDHVMFIRYQDRYGRDDDGWRIAERRVLVDWTESRAADPAPGAP